jgi:hypothetical protein
MPRVKIGPALPDRATLDVEIARLRDLDVGQLRRRLASSRGFLCSTPQASQLASTGPNTFRIAVRQTDAA